MAAMVDEVDIAVVGAGASGLGAARALEGHPVTVLVLEARDRIGGRASTVQLQSYPLDLGCGWLHSADRNPFSKIAQTLGFELDKSPPHWTRQASNIDFDPAEQAEFRKALEELEVRIEAAAEEGTDRPVAELFDPSCPWNPLLNAFSAYYNGAEFACISVLDYAAYEDSEVNWRIPKGYGALIAAYGASAPLALQTPVIRIDHHGPRLRLETDRGALSARAAIVTVPTMLLADQGLTFTPRLPHLTEAAAALPLGLADKVFLHLDGAEALEPESHLFGDPHRTETGSYHVRPFGRPMIEVYLAGRHAHALEVEGPGAAAQFAIEELVALLGSGFRTRLQPLASTAWAADPWSRGSYSHALPGCAHQRAVLAQPIESRIFIAGEATSSASYSTAHGAAAEGARAARQALEALGVQITASPSEQAVLWC
jgi:monoamine oxidase